MGYGPLICRFSDRRAHDWSGVDGFGSCDCLSLWGFLGEMKNCASIVVG
jgi:hypothetical protein